MTKDPIDQALAKMERAIRKDPDRFAPRPEQVKSFVRADHVHSIATPATYTAVPNYTVNVNTNGIGIPAHAYGVNTTAVYYG